MAETWHQTALIRPCIVCGNTHNRLPLDIGAEVPDAYLGLTAEERLQKAWVSLPKNPDFCRIDYGDQVDHFIRGVLKVLLPEIDSELVLGVWTTLSEANWQLARATWSTPEKTPKQPMFGYLATEFACYPGSMGLHTNIRLQPDSRPFVTLVDSEHEMLADQVQGMTLERWAELLHKLGRL